MIGEITVSCGVTDNRDATIPEVLIERADRAMYAAKRAGKQYGIPAREILVELGRRGLVGGQEDMIEDTAITMARARGLLPQRGA